MKTLADMKKEIIGRTIVLKERWGKPEDQKRTVSLVRSNDIVLLKEDGGKTYLPVPKASLVDYDGKTIIIYEPGVRDLNEEEQRIRNNEPKDQEQDQKDMMTDGSTMFYRRKHYYQSIGYEYLFASSKPIRGKYLTFKNSKPMIQDDAIKGVVSLRYEVT